MAEKVRVDKWLWAVRIFKSRSLATECVKAGKVKLGETTLKPASMIYPGQRISVKKNGFLLTFEVLKILEKRVSATIAQECYTDLTPPEELNKFKDWYVGKSGVEFREKGDGRPTKKDRREIDTFKDWYMEIDEDFAD
jgi:ribosome-associated heat shock protein Hsp15